MTNTFKFSFPLTRKHFTNALGIRRRLLLFKTDKRSGSFDKCELLHRWGRDSWFMSKLGKFAKFAALFKHKLYKFRWGERTHQNSGRKKERMPCQLNLNQNQLDSTVSEKFNWNRKMKKKNCSAKYFMALLNHVTAEQLSAFCGFNNNKFYYSERTSIKYKNCDRKW